MADGKGLHRGGGGRGGGDELEQLELVDHLELSGSDYHNEETMFYRNVPWWLGD